MEPMLVLTCMKSVGKTACRQQMISWQRMPTLGDCKGWDCFVRVVAEFPDFGFLVVSVGLLVDFGVN